MSELSQEERDRLSHELVKLGDMMGDGLHHDKGGSWITKEYKKIARLLYPEINNVYKKRNNSANIDIKMSEFLATKTCSKCNGQLKQSRSGSKVVKCMSCNARFKACKKKEF